MQIVLYNTKSNKNALNKILTEIETIECKVIEPCDVLNPVLLINTREINFSYIQISQNPFKRFYFVKNVEILDAGHIRVYLSVDVLMTYKNDILNSQVIAERSTSTYNKYVADEYDIVTDEKRYSFSRFPFSFDTSETGGNHYILTIGGK